MGKGKCFADCLESAGLARNAMLGRLAVLFLVLHRVSSSRAVAILRCLGFLSEHNGSLSSEGSVLFCLPF